MARKKIYIVVPFMSDMVTINEKDVVVFDDWNHALQYRDTLKGFTQIIRKELVEKTLID